MISWAEQDPTIQLTPAVVSTIVNDDFPPSTLDENPRPARIHVDDALLLALSREHMKMVLAALIEAIFVVIDTTWHVHRKSFTVREAQKLTGKLGHLGEGAIWVYHLLTHLYSSIAQALASNKLLLSESSREFQNIVESLRTGQFACSPAEQSRHISFALKRAAKLVHHANYKYLINSNMRKEIKFFREQLRPSFNIAWQTPLSHMIYHVPTAIAHGDSSLTGMGGYSLEFKFWWHIPVPEKVQRCTLLFKTDNKDGQLIDINILEFVTVIITYIASLHVFTTTNIRTIHIQSSLTSQTILLHSAGQSRPVAVQKSDVY